MAYDKIVMNRRMILGGMAATATLFPFGSLAFAQGLGLENILGKASDNALTKLSLTDAFYDDEDVRIGLPIIGKASGGLFGSVLSAGSKLGVLNGLTRNINNAAGAAAGEAKPIFRDAIGDLSFNDVPDLVSKNTGGTDYLRTSSGDALHEKLSPLMDSALGDLGVYNEFEKLSSKHSFIRKAGLGRESINKSVTDQGLDGIFSYIGAEETTFRKNPLGELGDTGKRLKGLF